VAGLPHAHARTVALIRGGPSCVCLWLRRGGGQVARVWNGEALTVTTAAGDDRKVFLASVRQPRLKEPAEAPYQAEAKEFLRARLIGKKVSASVCMCL
jgi:endonuclease YncB( thermonuclease family)